MDTSALSDALEFIATTDIRVWVGMIIYIVIFGIEMVLIRKGIILAGKKKRLEKAKALGNVVQGKLVRNIYDSGDENRSGGYRAYYEYELNGKTRTKILHKGKNPPSTVELYYVEYPLRIFTERTINPGCWSMGVMYLIPFIVMYFVMRLLGYPPQ